MPVDSVHLNEVLQAFSKINYSRERKDLSSQVILLLLEVNDQGMGLQDNLMAVLSEPVSDEI